MTIYDSGAHNGTTELTFATSLGTPVEGLRYRLSDGRGNTWVGSTGTGGKGVTILETEQNENPSSLALTWGLAGEADIQLEVQRNDGTWKIIGSFRHGACLHRQVNVIAGVIAVPFQMAPV